MLWGLSIHAGAVTAPLNGTCTVRSAQREKIRFFITRRTQLVAPISFNVILKLTSS